MSDTLKTVMISIPSIKAIKEFVSIVSNFSVSTTLKSGRHVVDAKSIMGIFSLDVSKPIELTIELNDNGVEDREFALMDAIKQFIVT